MTTAKPSYNIKKFIAATPNLRRMGVNSSELHVLRQIALETRGGQLRKLSASYLAKPLGLSRQWVNTLLKRLEKLKIITRHKTTMIRLNIELFSKNMDDAANRIRRKEGKYLKLMKKYQSVISGMHKRRPYIKREPEPAIYYHGTRGQAQNELAATYIPPHLRKNI